MSAELASIITCHHQQQRCNSSAMHGQYLPPLLCLSGTQHGAHACSLHTVGALWMLVIEWLMPSLSLGWRRRTELNIQIQAKIRPMHPLKRRHKSMTNQNFRILLALLTGPVRWFATMSQDCCSKTSTVQTQVTLPFKRIHPFHHLSDHENDLFPRPSY